MINQELNTSLLNIVDDGATSLDKNESINEILSANITPGGNGSYSKDTSN